MLPKGGHKQTTTVNSIITIRCIHLLFFHIHQKFSPFSIFGFVGLGVIGAGTVLSSFAAGIGNVSLIMILVTMVFAGALEEAGLTDFLADWFLKRKIFRKSPWLLIGGIVFGAFILSL